jgi:hypothetical protein
VKVIFLDKRHIRKLVRAAAHDEEWPALQRFIRHVRGHRDHLHVRVGDGPGAPGCNPGANPELEPEDVDPDAPDSEGVLEVQGQRIRDALAGLEEGEEGAEEEATPAPSAPGYPGAAAAPAREPARARAPAR